LFALASAGCALAHSIDSFVLLRFAQALGGSAGMVVIRAVIRDRFDAIQSARVLSLMMLVMGVAPILAPLAGGWLLVSGSWHWIFFVLAAYALFCVAAVFLFLEESHPPDARAPSVGRALAGVLPGIAGFAGVFGVLFLAVASVGLIASNAVAVALAPFGNRAGGASSLLGASQALTGVVASAAVGWIHAQGAVPMAVVVAA